MDRTAAAPAASSRDRGATVPLSVVCARREPTCAGSRGANAPRRGPGLLSGGQRVLEPAPVSCQRVEDEDVQRDDQDVPERMALGLVRNKANLLNGFHKAAVNRDPRGEAGPAS